MSIHFLPSWLSIWPQTESVDAFRQKMHELKSTRSQVLREMRTKPSVVILGAGPAGLVRAIDALLNGNPVKVIEKRNTTDPGRENTVALEKQTVETLQKFGVYQYMREKGMVFPLTGQSLNVRLKDLEQAMKTVIAELTDDPLIYYGCQVDRIIKQPHDKAIVIVKTDAGSQMQLDSVDLLVVAEGAHSHTSEMLLNNYRSPCLCSLPVVSAIFKDDRPHISSVSTFVQYVEKTLINTATAVYYYSIFIFKMFFEGENVYNPRRHIAGSLILPTPGQNYLGYGLTKEETEKMMAICKALKDAKEALRTATHVSSTELAYLQQRVVAAQKVRDDYLKYWTGMSFCFANILAIFVYVVTSGKELLPVASWLPFEHAAIAEIGADRSSSPSGRIGRTVYLLAGDTLATVDPTTGLGCNTAIKTLDHFHEFVAGIDRNRNVRSLLFEYNRCSNETVIEIHRESHRKRSIYRPDAAQVLGV